MARERVLGALALAFVSAPGFAQGIADPGERAFQYCFSCHSVDPNEQAVLQGPNLFGVIGRPIAAQAGFDYSEALKRFAAGGKRWTPELLAEFLQNPDALAPGTVMAKPPGPRTEAERAALLDYLKMQH
jgi:cytochrome c